MPNPKEEGFAEAVQRTIGVLTVMSDGRPIPYPRVSRDRAAYLRSLATQLLITADALQNEAKSITASCDASEEEW